MHFWQNFPSPAEFRAKRGLSLRERKNSPRRVKIFAFCRSGRPSEQIGLSGSPTRVGS
jgi:hypothetical protein